ncbi:MAG: Gfo/Idh/MocA family oxidoreductase [Caldilineaceae bacterium]
MHQTTHRVGIVGCGRISHQHFKAPVALAAHTPANTPPPSSRYQIVAACDVDQALLDARCAEYDITHRFTKVDDLAACPEVDVAVVVTPPHIRLAVARPLLEAGKDLLIEKPFTESMAEAHAIVDLAERLGRQVAVNQNYRWFPAIQQVRQQIEAGAIGAPTYAIINDCVWRDEVGGWRKETSRLALAVMGIHWLDRLRWLLLDEPVAVSCITAARPTLASGGENETTTIIEFRKGAMATVTHSWSSHARGSTNFQQFDGPLGSFILHNDAEVTLRNSAGEEQWSLPRDFTASFGESLTRLLDAIESGQPAPHSARDNLMTMALLEACYQSAAEKRRVEI